MKPNWQFFSFRWWLAHFLGIALLITSGRLINTFLHQLILCVTAIRAPSLNQISSRDNAGTLAIAVNKGF